MPKVENKPILLLLVAKFIGFHRKIGISSPDKPLKNPYVGGVYRGWYIGLLQQLYISPDILSKIQGQTNSGIRTSITADLKLYTIIMNIGENYLKNRHDHIAGLFDELSSIKLDDSE